MNIRIYGFRIHSSVIILLGIWLIFTTRMISARYVGLEVDEPINFSASRYVLAVGYPAVKAEITSKPEPFFFHPPFYYYFMAGWFRLAGANYQSARFISIVCSTLAITLLIKFIKKRIGNTAALLALVTIGSDVWLIVTNSMVYIENVLLVLIVLTVFAFYYAAKFPNERLRLYTISGILIGISFIFKHLGVYMVFAWLAYWLLTRNRIRGNLTSYIHAGIVTVLYIALMLVTWGETWWQPTYIQLLRTFGFRFSRGLNYDIGTMVQVIFDRYWIFSVTIFSLVVGSALTIYMYVCQLAKRCQFSQPVLVIMTWGMGAIIFGAGTSLRSPHYFMLWLLPFWSVITIMVSAKITNKKHLKIMVSGVLVLNSLAFGWRVLTPHGDTLRETADYINTQISREALVASEPYICNMINQRCTRSDQTSLRRMAVLDVDYIAVYSSSTAGISEQIGGDNVIWLYCNPTKEFRGFKDQITLCEVDHQKLRTLLELTE